MSSKRKPLVRYSDELAIKAYILKETTSMTHSKIGEQLNICSGSVSIWAKRVRGSARLKAQARDRMAKPKRVAAKLKEKKSCDSGNGLEIAELMTENAYLRWWNLGLQEGFVDRLLKETGQK